jgi:hypothetical protein
VAFILLSLQHREALSPGGGGGCRGRLSCGQRRAGGMDKNEGPASRERRMLGPSGSGARRSGAGAWGRVARLRG